MEEFWVTRISDGVKFKCKFEDRGDTVPCYDLNNQAFRGYTSYVEIEDPDANPTPVCVYHQMDAAMVDASSDAAAFREYADFDTLKQLGYEADPDHLEYV